MQNIIRTTKTANFTILDNAIINAADLSALARMALIYLLSKPPTWKVRATDIKRHLGVGINKVYRLLQELRSSGYVIMKRVQSAVHWFVYDVPQSSTKTATSLVVTDRDGFHHDGNSDELERIETPVRTEKTTTPCPVIDPAPASKTIEVVVFDEKGKESPADRQKAISGGNDKDPIPPHIGPDQNKEISGEIDKEPIPCIAANQQRAARKVLRELSEDQAALVLSAFTLALSKHNVSSKIGYLVGLVRAMKSGTFTPVQPQHGAPASTPNTYGQNSWAGRGGSAIYGYAGGVPVLSLAERLEKERKRQHEAQNRGKMSNDEHAAWLAREFGNVGQSSPLSDRLLRFVGAKE